MEIVDINKDGKQSRVRLIGAVKKVLTLKVEIITENKIGFELFSIRIPFGEDEV